MKVTIQLPEDISARVYLKASVEFEEPTDLEDDLYAHRELGILPNR